MNKEIVAPHLTPMERQLYESGHTETYRDFLITPKRDFGSSGYWSSEHRCNLNAGWIVGYARGGNAAPGATFAWTLASARNMIDDIIEAGGAPNHDAIGERIDSDKFWALTRARHAA